jgi:RHS repeat-associated protein
MDNSPLFNIMDSITGWITPAGGVRGRIYYDPFGQIVRQTGRTSVSKFGFAGYLYNEHSKTYQLAARTYHPYLGRFLQRDPLGFSDGTNLYAYAHHAPGSLTDYWGLMATDISWSDVAHKALIKIGIGALSIAIVALVLRVLRFVAGAASLPITLAMIGSLAVAQGIYSYSTRANEALEAGMTDFQAKAALAALGDVLNLTNIHESITRRNAVTGRPLGGEELEESISSAFSGIGLGLFGGKVSTAVSNLTKRGLPGSSTWKMNKALEDPRFQPISQRKIGASGFTPNALGIMAEGQMQSINRIPYIPEMQLPVIPSATGTASFRRLDAPIIPAKVVLGEKFPSEFPQVKYVQRLSRRDLDQIVDTLRAARSQGAVVGLYVRPGLRLNWTARSAYIIDRLAEINAARAGGEIIVYNLY